MLLKRVINVNIDSVDGMRKYLTYRNLYLSFFFILLGHGLFAYLFLDPLGDALILFCFSENLANTGIISYFPGGPPAEGATDFLWMLIISLFYKAGIPSFLSTQILTILGVLGMVFYIEKLYRFYYKRRISKGILVIIFLGVLLNPMYYKAALYGFSVCFYGASLAVFIYYYSTRQIKKTAISALFVCLIRPDGFVVVTPLFLFLIWESYRQGKEPLVKTIKIFAYYTILPGILYFISRWWYFGELFPLPYLVKSGSSHNNFSIFKIRSITNLIDYIFIFMVVFGLYYIKTKKYSRKFPKLDYGIFFSILTLIFFYSTVIHSQNVGGRFFIGIFLLLLTLSFYLPRRVATIVVIITPLFFLDINSYLNKLQSPFYVGNFSNIASDLKKLSPHGKLLTSEAGHITYYSTWEAEDIVGLNTAKYAKFPIKAIDVKTYNPDFILLYNWYESDYSPSIDSVTCHLSSSGDKFTSFHSIKQYAAKTKNYEPFIIPRVFYITPIIYWYKGIKQLAWNSSENTSFHTVLLNKKSLLFEGMKTIVLNNGGKSACDFIKHKSPSEVDLKKIIGNRFLSRFVR